MKTNEIDTLNFRDIPAMARSMKYYDEALYFGDDMTDIPNIGHRCRIGFVVLVFCLRGKMTVRLNDVEFHLTSNDAMFIDTNTVVAASRDSQDLNFKLCAINSGIRYSLINKTLFDAIINLQEQPVVHFSDEEIGIVEKYYELANYKMMHPHFCANKESMDNLLRAFAIDLLYSINQHTQPADTILRQGDKLYRNFVYLVQSNTDGKRSVKSFADELCVSPKYLTSVCRQHSGRTANEIITERVVGRIMHLLNYSDMSVKEIATALNFDNLSFFGKYVKKHLGLSPNNYRKTHKYGL